MIQTQVNKITVTPVILCGGSGTRLWPLSRMDYPKQFLCLNGSKSLFQQTYERLTCIDSPYQKEKAIIIAGESHRFLLLDQLQNLVAFTDNLFQIILEPMGKNTAPALTLAALKATEQGKDSILVVSPSDHAILDIDAFTQSLNNAIEHAREGYIVTLGVPPYKPETAYGYIQVGQNGQDVQKFIEKPDIETAQKFIQEEGYFWNAGVFVLKASVWLKAIQYFRADIFNAVQESWVSCQEDILEGVSLLRPDKEKFSIVPHESIDYAVMEKCYFSPFSIKMISLQAGWSDLGTWNTIWEMHNKDNNDNVVTGDVLLENSCRNLVYATHRQVSLVGVSDSIVIETPDAILVSHQVDSQAIKNIVNRLIVKQRNEAVQHRKVYRPWGWYDNIDVGEGFKVKKIFVKPRARLSLQKPQYRSEHWIIVRGMAEVTCGNDTSLFSEGQGTHIPIGAIHRLRNPSDDMPLEIIEIQTGSYLEEDDITRIEDDWNR